MSKYMLWAIDPRNRPNASELRNALADKEVYRKRLWADWVYEQANGVGIVPVKDALYTRDYLRISAEIEQFNDTAGVSAILLDINSPGGVVNGAIECASTIRNSKKPVYAYIEGMGCSAAYLLASATKGIYASPSSEVGSIGVQGAWTNYEGLFAKLGIQKVYFVSKNSEKKNLSPATKEGKAAVQKLLDETWDIFADAIAKGRNVSIEEIVEKYGQGEVYLAQEGKERGLVDNVLENFNACVEEIYSPDWGEGEMEMQDITTVDALIEAYPQLVAQIKGDERKAGVEEGTQAERQRVASLFELSEHTDLDTLSGAVKDGKTSDVFMKDILDKQKEVKKEAQKEIETELAKAVKQSEEVVAVHGQLAESELLLDDEQHKTRINQIAENYRKEGKKKEVVK